MPHPYRDFIQLDREDFNKVFKKFKASNLNVQKLGNRYSTKLKIYYTDECNRKKDMVLYCYAEVVDPKSNRRRLKDTEYYLNPKYKNLLEDDVTIIMMRGDLLCRSTNS